MVGVKNIRLKNVRSHTSSDFQFVKGMNAIVGPNGSGKTTVLEALYTLLRGTSFKGSLSEILMYGSSQFFLELELKTDTTNHLRSLKYQQDGLIPVKKWQIDSKNYTRLPLQARLPVVLFEPDFAKLISGSPEKRRQYIDNLSGQLDIEIASAQSKLERTLRQRNQLLKSLRTVPRRDRSEQLFVWNTQLAQLSEQVVKARLKIIDSLQKEVNGYYRDLGGTDDVFLTYASSISNESTSYASKLLQFLETSEERDIILGHTSFGSHRDDIEIRLADQPAHSRASRGEIRTVVIALKLLETKLLAKHFKPQNIKPILLLDDVLSELDLVHQEQVLAGVKNHQVFLTTTDAHALTPGVHTIGLD